MENIERLQINTNLLENSAIAYSGYAKALIKSERKEVEPLIASSYLYAAVYNSLNNQEQAKKDFGDATNYYRKLNNPYAGIMAICNLNQSEGLDFIKKLRKNDIYLTGPDTWLTALLLEIWTGEGEDLWKWSQLPEEEVSYRAKRIQLSRCGRLGIQFNLYAEAKGTESKIIGLDNSVETGIENTATLLKEASKHLASAMLHKYHWSKLYSRILPLEPEVLAACISLLTYYSKNKNISNEEFLRRIKNYIDDSIALVPLEVAIKFLDLKNQ